MEKHEMLTEKIRVRQVILSLILFIICVLYLVVKCDDLCTIETDRFEETGSLSEFVASDEYVQQFECDSDGLKFIRVCFTTFDRTNFSHLFVRLCDAAGNEISSWTIDCNLLGDKQYYTLALDKKLKLSKGDSYYLHLTTDAKEGQGIAALYSDASSDHSALTLNGERIDGSLCYQLVYKDVYKLVSNKVNWLHIIAVLLGEAFLFVFIMLDKDISFENSFLIMWIIVSFMYFLSMTLFRAPDEENHFYRAYEVSYGYFLSDVNEDTGAGGRELPLYGADFSRLEKSWREFRDNADEVRTSDTMEFRSFSNTALYSPLSYIPQALGVFLARNVSSYVAVIAYAGRFMNWLFITVLLYLAIKIMPFGKDIMALILLMPMNVHESISLAPDGMVVALAFLMMAFVIHARYKKETVLSLGQIVFLYVMAVFISLMKVVYLPLGLMYFLIPAERFGSMKRKLVHIIAMAALAVGTNLMWLRLCTKFLVHKGSNATIQLGYLLHHFDEFIVILARTIFDLSDWWATTMIGSRLAELNVTTVGILVLLYICLLVNRNLKYAHACEDKDDKTVKIICGICTLSILILTFVSLYLQWTPVYNNEILGIQGRYFIVLLLPVFLMVSAPSYLKKLENGQSILSKGEDGFIVCINACACISLLFSCIRL